MQIIRPTDLGDAFQINVPEKRVEMGHYQLTATDTSGAALTFDGQPSVGLVPGVWQLVKVDLPSGKALDTAAWLSSPQGSEVQIVSRLHGLLCVKLAEPNGATDLSLLLQNIYAETYGRVEERDMGWAWDTDATTIKEVNVPAGCVLNMLELDVGDRRPVLSSRQTSFGVTPFSMVRPDNNFDYEFYQGWNVSKHVAVMPDTAQYLFYVYTRVIPGTNSLLLRVGDDHPSNTQPAGSEGNQYGKVFGVKVKWFRPYS